jgi:hypothetical protein
MKRGLLCVVLLVACAGCVKEHQCRDGNVFLTVHFVDTRDLVDGLSLSYLLDLDSGSPTSIFPTTSPLMRPPGKDQGGLELQVANYAEHQSLILKYVPTKKTSPVGEWQKDTIPLEQGCSTSTLQVQIKSSDGAVVGVDAGADSGGVDAGADSGGVDAGADSGGVDARPDRPAADLAGNTSDLAAPMTPETSRDLGVTQDSMDAAMPERDAPQLADTLDAPAAGSGDASGGSGGSRDSPGSADCNSEAPPTDDPMNCGACGQQCVTSERCGAGHCCPIGSAWCPTDGGYTCIDITYDPVNCGSCGKTCSIVGTECCGGSCMYTRDFQHDPNNCRVCGNVCDDPGDFSDACMWLSECKKATCGDNGKGAIICNPQ